MPLDKNMLLTAVELSNGYKSIGTGFFVTVDSEIPDTDPYGYLVTAHHVIHDRPSVFAEIPDASNGEVYPPLPVNNWVRPLSGVDVAVALMNDPGDRNYSGIPFDQIMPVGDILSPHLGARLLYIGFFAPAHRMLARSATIASLDQTGLSKELDDLDIGLEYVDYPVHLVDCRSYDGFSGSPCYVEISYPGAAPLPLSPHIPLPPAIAIGPVGRMHYCSMLCGMFIAHFTDEGLISSESTKAISKHGVGMMVRGNEIRAALMHNVLVKERQERDKERIANMPP